MRTCHSHIVQPLTTTASPGIPDEMQFFAQHSAYFHDVIIVTALWALFCAVTLMEYCSLNTAETEQKMGL